ncbi:MAG TPA: penicillin acylase family protein [Geminicoccus sp.]|uniref:penicillin acylase family protein n=1 Tax=Geminicoccus sp. TaxID=2024832 RepID=UPI002CC26FB4|nr:penicillin acylase family protein [Geminicoccus sp.]HWL70728.1 penicillin acylase family protein [Geminicoccus sp.]
MRRPLRLLAGTVILLLLLTILLMLTAGIGSLPRTSGSYRLAGLDGPVAVGRDRFGVPHIRASSERDAYRALGFVQAQDRLWQMEFQRRVGQGRLAELVGPAALPIDRHLRVLGLYRAAEQAVAGLDPATRTLLDAYVQGVNDWIEGRDRLLPPEFWIFWHRPERWTAADSAVWVKMMALTLDGDMSAEILRQRLSDVLPPELIQDLWPGMALPKSADSRLSDRFLAELAAALPAPPGPGTGSNAFAVAARRSASGGALLAGDPHLELRSPGVWYLAHLEAPGLAVTGATLPGLPFVVIGRTRQLAWSLTTTGADVQDLFVETLDPADPAAYLTPEGSQPFSVRTERIGVAGEADQVLSVRTTRHGPVISDLVGVPHAAGTVVSLAWTVLDPDDRTIRAGFRLPYAQNIAEARQVLRDYHNPVQNFVMADAAGQIGLVVAGAVPVRRGGDGSMPVDGTSGRFDWTGTIPPDELPARIDPISGSVANSNDRVVDDDYPHLVATSWEPDWRRQRIDALLAARPMLDGSDLIDIQRDHRSGFAVELLPTLLRARGLAPELAALLPAMAGWDGTMAEESWQAGLFLAWAEHFARRVRADELGPAATLVGGLRGAFLANLLRSRQNWCDDRRTEPVEDCAQIAGLALADAHRALVDAFGARPQAWMLQRVQHAELAHAVLGDVPLLGGWFGQQLTKAGDPYSVDVAGARVDASLVRRTVTHAASLRMVADLAEPEGIRIVTAGGQSGHPMSRWFSDGARRWEQDIRIHLPASEQTVLLSLVP